MKRVIALVATLAIFVACSKEKETQTEPEWLKETKALLVGTWYGEKYSETLNITEAEEIKFEPSATVQKIVSLVGTFDAYGVAYMTEYINGKPSGYSSVVGGAIRCYYSLEWNYGHDYVVVSFYQLNDDSYITRKIDDRILLPVSNTEFIMRPYGTAESCNMTYNKK